MSVPLYLRGIADTEFLITALELDAEITRFCKKDENIPKKLTFYKGQKISQLATDVFENVIMGNSIYPTNQHEAQRRRDYFLTARGKAYFLVAQLEVLIMLKDNINLDEIEKIMPKVRTELDLIKGVLKSDSARYKKLFGNKK